VDEVLEKEVDDQGGDQQPVLPSLVADDAKHGGEGWVSSVQRTLLSSYLALSLWEAWA
jgi:hypothetical protein